MPDVLVTVTLFRESDGAQLAGPAMVKTDPAHITERITGCICRWAGLPIASCRLLYNGKPLDPRATVAASGLISSSAINAMVSHGAPAPDPAACAAAFAMLDVEDSELAAVMAPSGF